VCEPAPGRLSPLTRLWYVRTNSAATDSALIRESPH
jgi:hypothetical protein